MSAPQCPKPAIPQKAREVQSNPWLALILVYLNIFSYHLKEKPVKAVKDLDELKEKKITYTIGA